MALNQERVMLLIEALESGDFNQIKGALRIDVRDKPCFCCLGVACELAVQHGVIPPAVYDGRWKYLGEYEHLPRLVRDWYGFSDDDPHLPTADYRHYLSMVTLNDGRHESFKEIAQFLRRALLEENTELGDV